MKRRPKRPSTDETSQRSSRAGNGVPHPLWFVVVLLGVVCYLIAFFATKLSTLSVMVEATVTRFSLFSYLLVPEELIASWCTDFKEFALWQRVGVLLPAMAIVLSAFGLGSLILVILKFDSLRKPQRFTRWEISLFATGIGLNLLSTGVLAMGLAGELRSPWLPLLLLAVGIAAACRQLHAWWKHRHDNESTLSRKRLSEERLTLSPRWLWFAVPSIVVVLLLGMIPSSEYDVNSYHLQAPREFYASGTIDHVEHNVYANMPLGAEMHCLLGMMLTGDWFRGAMIGKTVIAFFLPLGGIAVWMAGRRLFSNTAGMLGLILYVSIPWLLYVSGIGLVEGVFAFYQFLAVYALLLFSGLSFRGEDPVDGRLPGSLCLLFLSGLFAGAAASVKYTGVPFVVFPLGIWATFASWRSMRAENYGDNEQKDIREQKIISEKKYTIFMKNSMRWGSLFSAESFVRLIRGVAVYTAAVLLAAGPWYAKNYALTGNPVYPLAFNLFGDQTGTWDPVKNERWTTAHHARDFSPARLANDATRVVLKSPWLPPLVLPFFLLGFLRRKRRRIDLFLLAYLGYVFVLWWLATHRLDRFWMTVFPIFALYAGIGATWSHHRRWRIALLVLLTISTVYVFIVSSMAGPGKYNRLFASYETMRHDPYRIGRWARYYNIHPPRGRLLMIGEARAFFFDKQPYYNTCFNDLLLQEIVEGNSPSAIRENFRRYGITDIYINWKEVDRFRSPGNYGYPEFVTQQVINRLERQGILQPIAPIENSSGRGYRVIWESSRQNGAAGSSGGAGN